MQVHGAAALGGDDEAGLLPLRFARERQKAMVGHRTSTAKDCLESLAGREIHAEPMA